MLCIIHVGLHHTATTSFQNFLFKNRETLSEYKIIYPLSGTHANQHSLIPGACLPDHHALKIPRILDPHHYLDSIKVECQKKKYELCIFASKLL